MTIPQYDILISHITGLKEDIKKNTELLTGNGDPKKGIIVRLDRVEVKLRRADWVVKAVFVAAAGAIAAAIAAKFIV